MATDALERVGEEVGRRLDQIRQCFVSGSRVSVFVRFPGKPDQDFILTDDQLREVSAMIERRLSPTPPEEQGRDEG